MPSIDDLIRTVDVDAALAGVLARHQKEVRHAKRNRILLAAACIVAVVGLAWVAWPNGDDESVDTIAPPAPPINQERTPASASDTTDDGLRVTASIDDDTVPLGEAIAIDITVTNESDTTMFAGWDQGIECSSVDALVVTPDGAPLPEQPEEPGWDPDQPIGPVVLNEAATVFLSRPTKGLARNGTPCLAMLPHDPLEPGETKHLTGSWIAWFSPGALPNDGELLLSVQAASSNDSLAPIVDYAEVDIPVTIDPTEGALPTPTAAQLNAVMTSPEVTTLLAGLEPNGLVNTYDATLARIGRLWALLLGGNDDTGDDEGDAAIWIDGRGELVTITRSNLGAPLHLPPEAQLCLGGCGLPAASSPVLTPASATAVDPQGMRITVDVSDDAIAVGESTEVTITITNEGDEPIQGSWSQLLECSQDVDTRVVAGDDEPGEPLGTTLEWDGDPDTLAIVVNADPPYQYWSAPTQNPVPMQGGCPDQRIVDELAPGQSASATGRWNAWFSPGPDVPDQVVVRTTGAPYCQGCEPEPISVEVPITLDSSNRPGGLYADLFVEALERDDVRSILDEFGPNEQAPPDPPTYGVFLVQVGEDFVLRIHGNNGAADIWFSGTYGTGDEFGPTKFEQSEVIDVQRLTAGDVIDVPDDGIDANPPEPPSPAPAITEPPPPTTDLLD